MPTFETLISKDKIQARVSELAKEITKFYEDEDFESLLVIGILRGGLIFLSDLVRQIPLPQEIDFLEASSYGSETTSSGEIKILRDVSTSLAARHVLVIEDIVDTGLTMSVLLERFAKMEPASLKLCTLLHKPSRQVRPVKIDFLGFTIDDHFVVGYGLDFNNRYREFDEIKILKN